MGGWQSSNQHNKEKSCDSSLISYFQVPPPPPLKKVLLEIVDHFVTSGNIQMGEDYRVNAKISRACWDFCNSLHNIFVKQVYLL